MLDSFTAIAQMIKLVGGLGDRARPDVFDLSDEDVEREFQQSKKRLIQEHPEIAVECARQPGRDVTPTSIPAVDV